MEFDKKDPNIILEEIKNEEKNNEKGKLKIFFGYAAGVGKTYAMLEAAHEVKKEGIDVVCGYIEQHSRPDTLKLLDGLEQLPVLEVNYNNIVLKEFNLDLALKRHPKIILVDEFAHTNAKGLRHDKRYQDIKELLNNGIDVFTTVNVQHIESLNDIVCAITGITVREKIPDYIFDEADEIKIIDIEPKDLIERINKGKIYKEKQANRAVNNYFSIENLTALREIALRKCADQVNNVSEKHKIKKHDDYFTNEHILVGISSSPSNAKIIRTAARIAHVFKGYFTAVFVETSDYPNMSKENKQRIMDNIKLAETLGAKIETVYGDNIAYQIALMAKTMGISRIVVGRSSATSNRLFKKQTLVEKLINYVPQTDIFIIPDNNVNRNYYNKKIMISPKRFIEDLGISILIITLATIIGLVFQNYDFGESNIILMYVFGVVITSIFITNRVFTIISSTLAVLTFNFFFTEPYYSLKAYDAHYPLTFIIMFLTAFLTSTLALRLKNHANKSISVAYKTKLLLETNQALQQVKTDDEILEVTAKHLIELTKRDIITYKVENNLICNQQVYHVSIDNKEMYQDATEQAVVTWVYKNNKHAGATTNTLNNAKCLYLAVRNKNRVYAVVGIARGVEPLDSFQKSILLSILGECALALENENNRIEKEKAAILAKNEQLKSNLLRAISHDLRTPLTSISGNASNFLSNEKNLDESTKRQLFEDIYDDSMWLINLVENLLSVTKLEENRLNLNLTTEILSDVIDEALKHISRKKIEHNIVSEYDDEIILAAMDTRLIIQVIINIVDNAIKYTPIGSTITIKTLKENNEAIILISDDGDGISDEMKPKIFDMFYSGNNKIADSKRSLGLGLSLCKSIINAHQGTISVYDNLPKGTVFKFSLPLGGEINE